MNLDGLDNIVLKQSMIKKWRLVSFRFVLFCFLVLFCFCHDHDLAVGANRPELFIQQTQLMSYAHVTLTLTNLKQQKLQNTGAWVEAAM